MIREFKHRGCKRLYENGDRRKIRADMVARVENILSVRANWRIVFAFRGGDAYDVDLIDYH